MTSIDAPPPGLRPRNPERESLASRLNWLRAGVLGANDGIVSVAAIVVGVAGATSGSAPLLTAGLAGLVGGAVSMALGEYISVSSQRDTQKVLIAEERVALREQPAVELEALAALYRERGLSEATALQVAAELSAKDALGAHLEARLHIDEDDVVSPWHAALASAVAFTIGGVLPLLAILLLPHPIRVPVTFVAVLLALALTGATSARIGGSPIWPATVRVVIGGGIALAATFLIGNLLGASGVV